MSFQVTGLLQQNITGDKKISGLIATLLEWRNILYVPPSSVLKHTKLKFALGAVQWSEA